MTVPASSSALVDRLVEVWCTRDRAHAFVDTDLDVIASTAGIRACAAEHLLRTAWPSTVENSHCEAPQAEIDRDLLHAFGALGRAVGERGGSPTLAATTVDGARQALDALDRPRPDTIREPRPDAAWVMPARAALIEAFVAAKQSATWEQAAARWEYPRCMVGLNEHRVAIVAGYAEDDTDALAAWAARVAHGAALASVRQAVVSGSRAARAALIEALEVAGIEPLAAFAIGRGGQRWG